MERLEKANPTYYDQIMEGRYGTPKAWRFDIWRNNVYVPIEEEDEEVEETDDDEDVPF